MKKSEIHLFIREKMLTIFGWHFEIRAVQKHVNLVIRSRQDLSNEYLLAKIGVDTVENERASQSSFNFQVMGLNFHRAAPPLRLICFFSRVIRTRACFDLSAELCKNEGFAVCSSSAHALWDFFEGQSWSGRTLSLADLDRSRRAANGRTSLERDTYR